MMATKINDRAGRVIPYLVVAAVASLATSWGLQTPALEQKAETLDVVQQKVIPSMAGQLAATKTKLKQSDCDKDRIANVAAQGILATQHAAPAPTWDDIQACARVAPVKPQIPVVTVTAQK